MVKILLTKNKRALVDKKYLPLISKYTWHFDGRYAATTLVQNKKLKKIYMHRLILPKIKMIDHINQDKLDNQLVNLRPTNKSKNALNISASTGVYFVKTGKRRKRWNANITLQNKKISLGYFFTRQEANTAYLTFKKAVLNG